MLEDTREAYTPPNFASFCDMRFSSEENSIPFPLKILIQKALNVDFVPNCSTQKNADIVEVFRKSQRRKVIPLSHPANHGRLLFNRVANLLTYPYPQAETVYLMVPICSLQGTQQHPEKEKK